jgi:hypothetical protein
MATAADICDPPVQSLYRLSVAQYDQLARLGVLTKEDRVELIEGLLVKKMTKNERHLTTVWLIQSALSRRLPEGWFAVTESPILLARSEPEPDVMIVRGEIRDYFRRKPTSEDVPLIVEVSDSSYADDRQRRHYYAESRIATYWIANIPARRIEVYTDPADGDYQTRLDHGWGDLVEFAIGDQSVRLDVSDLMPPPE